MESPTVCKYHFFFGRTTEKKNNRVKHKFAALSTVRFANNILANFPCKHTLTNLKRNESNIIDWMNGSRDVAAFFFHFILFHFFSFQISCKLKWKSPAIVDLFHLNVPTLNEHKVVLVEWSKRNEELGLCTSTHIHQVVVRWIILYGLFVCLFIRLFHSIIQFNSIQNEIRHAVFTHALTINIVLHLLLIIIHKIILKLNKSHICETINSSNQIHEYFNEFWPFHFL